MTGVGEPGGPGGRCWVRKKSQPGKKRLKYISHKNFASNFLRCVFVGEKVNVLETGILPPLNFLSLSLGDNKCVTVWEGV